MSKKELKKYHSGKIGSMVNFIATEYNLDEGMLRAKLALEFPALKDKSHCANCGANMQSFWHDVTPGIISALVKAISFVKKNNKNKFHLARDLDLSKSEYNNFQKLRFHALVTKVKDDAGYWLITKRGGEFLRGDIHIPRQVQTFRNLIIDHSEEMIHMNNFKNKFPEFQSEFLVNLEQGSLL